MRKVVFCPANSDGCAFFRMFMTHLRYPDSVFVLPPKGHGVSVEILKLGEIAMVQRQTTKINLHGATIIKQLGLKYIYDLDDNLWHVPKYNQAKGYFQQQIQGTEKCMAMADHITVSTQHLASIVKRKINLHCPLTVVENAIDLSLFGRARRQKDESEILIGWAGTNTHSLDLQLITPPLMEVMRKRKNVIVEFFGGDFPIEERYVKEMGKERFRFRPWVPIEMWPAACSNLPWDISLAPLLDTSFNASKSSIKLVEAGALKMPCMASATREYVRFAEDSPELTDHLICARREDWYDKLMPLIDSKDLRMSLGELMHERVKTRYNMEQRVEEWRAVFESN